MERYIDILKSCGVDIWFIKEKSVYSNELFFIKKKLDMRRINNSKDSIITVYCDKEIEGEKMRGRSDIIVADTMSDEEIKKMIKDALYAASFSLNPFFELPAPEVSDTVVNKSTLNDIEFSKIADKFADAAYEVDNDKDAFINSMEIFVEEHKVHMRGSTGTDVSYVKRVVNGELITQCKSLQDVETYEQFAYDDLSIDDFKRLIKNTLKHTKDRSFAKDKPKTGISDVIISDAHMPELMKFYFERGNAAMIYPEYSNYKIGLNVQGDDVKGDKLNILYEPVNPFNDEGIKMIERPFLEDGVVKTICGNQRLSYYLGIPQIGSYGKGKMPAGKVSLDDMKKDCLYVVNFSSFETSEMDGSFRGEIRLAYAYDKDGNESLITGGSVNGSLLKSQKDFCFSKEMQNLDNYIGPLAVKLKGVNIGGE